MKTLAAIALLLVTMIPAHAQTPAQAKKQTAKPGANLTGKWTGTMTRTAPDGRSQTIPWLFDLTQKADVVTGTCGPTAERQWALQKGAVKGGKITFQVQQPEGPLRTFTLELVKDRLTGDMLAEAPSGQSFTTKVDAGRDK